jgi:hypothetical protein
MKTRQKSRKQPEYESLFLRKKENDNSLIEF